MNISAAFSFPFKDPNWVTKMIWFSIFLLLSPLLIGIPFFLGYKVLTTRNVIERKENLPEWTGNWTNLFNEGMRYLVLILIVSAIGVFISYLGMPLLNFLWTLTSLVLSTLLLAKVAIAKKFEEIFDLSWYIEFTKNNLGNLIIVTILSLLLSVIAGMGFILCIIGVFFTIYYSMIVGAYLTGDMYKVGEDKPARKRRKKSEEVEIVNDVEE